MPRLRAKLLNDNPKPIIWDRNKAIRIHVYPDGFTKLTCVVYFLAFEILAKMARSRKQNAATDFVKRKFA